ncbi:MAG: HAMP domain-containing protein, partial [Myxococcales bacterium]|nr:HAMP domain-containing protein [Myxococcales bacterium]
MSDGALSARAGRRFISLGTKLAAFTSCVLLFVASCLFFELSARERTRLIEAKRNAAAMVTQLLATETAAALDFGDADDILAKLRHLRTNRDVGSAVAWSAGAEKPTASWTARGWPAGEAPAGDVDGVSPSGEWLFVTKDVLNPQSQPVGRVRVAFSLAPENDAFQSSRVRLFWGTAGFTLATAALLVLFARRYIIRPLHALSRASRALASGDLRVRVDRQTNDEIGDLTRAFNAMGDAVAVRQRQVESRNEDMRLVLDHVAQGLFTVDQAGVIAPEYSHAVVDWLGAPGPGETLWSFFARFDASLGVRLQLGWEAMVEGVLPLELTLEQMPKAMKSGERSLRFGYVPIASAGGGLKVLVVLSDVSPELARERADAACRELAHI